MWTLAAETEQRRSGRFTARASFRRVALVLGALVLTAPALTGSALLSAPAVSGSLRARVDLVRTVDFEGYAPNTEITSQYSGITFEYPATAGFTYGTSPKDGVVRDVNGPPIVVASGAHSGSQAGSLVRTAEFGTAGTFAALTNLADRVSVYVGDLNGAVGDHVELDAYGANRNLLGSDTAVTTAAGASTQLSYSTGGAGSIAYVAIYRTDVLDKDEVIDDLSVSVPPNTAPIVGVAASATGYELGQGGSRQVTVRVNRLDGANQPATIAIAGLPSGVTATLSPNPVALPETTSSLTLAASPGAAIGTYPVSLSASAPGALSQAPVSVALSVVAPLQLSVPGTLQVGGCSSAQATVEAQVAPGRTGPVSFSTSTSSTLGLASSVGPAQVVLSSGVAKTTLGVTSAGGSGAGTVRVTASLPDGASESAVIAVSEVGPQVTSVDAQDRVNGMLVAGRQAETPRAGVPGTTVEITGHYFCQHATVAFGNPEATVAAAVHHESGNQGPYDYLRVSTPRDATSGPVTVTAGSPSASGTSSSSLTVDSYRNAEAFRFANFLPRLTFDDLTRAFGAQQTYLNVNPCGFLTLGIANCAVPLVPDPVALAWLGIAQASMQNGTCFGMSLTDQRLLEGQIALDSLARTSESVYGLDGPAITDRTALGHEPILLQLKASHLMQLSTEFLSAYVKRVGAQLFEGPHQVVGGIVQEIRAAFAKGHFPLVSLDDTHGGGGHVVVAYDLAAAASGGYDIYVYDSNSPFSAGEATDGATHAKAVAASVIHLTAGGSWSLASTTEPDGSTPFHGGKEAIVVTDPSVVPLHPTLATLGGAAPGLLFSSAAAPGSAGAGTAGAGRVVQVSGAGKTLYRADGSLNADPRTRLDAAPFAPLVARGASAAHAPALTVLGPSVREVTVTTAGLRSGTTSQSLVEGSFAGTVTTTGAKGAASQERFSPSTGSVGSSSPLVAPVSLVVERSSATGWRTVKVVAAGVRGGSDTLRLGADGTVVVAHHGPATTITLTVSGASKQGLPAAVTTAPIALGTDQTARVGGIDWRSLAASSLTVRVGSRTRHVRLAGNAAHVVSIGQIAFRPASGHRLGLVLTGRLAALPAGGVARATWVLHRGRHLVAEHVATVRGRRGSFRVAWTVPWARVAGSTLAAVVVVSSPSAAGVRSGAASRSARVPVTR